MVSTPTSEAMKITVNNWLKQYWFFVFQQSFAFHILLKGTEIETRDLRKCFSTTLLNNDKVHFLYVFAWWQKKTLFNIVNYWGPPPEGKVFKSFFEKY